MLGRGLLYLMANLLHHVLIISGSAKGQRFALVTLHTDPLEIYVHTKWVEILSERYIILILKFHVSIYFKNNGIFLQIVKTSYKKTRI